MCAIVILTNLLLSAKEDIDLSRSEVIVLYSLVNLRMNINIENVVLETNTIYKYSRGIV